MPLHQGVDNLSGLATDTTLLPPLVYTGLQEGVFRLCIFPRGAILVSSLCILAWQTQDL